MDKNSNILITGHNGMVGSSILNRLEQEGYENIFTYNKALIDLKDQSEVNHIFQSQKFDYVIMCAAVVGGIKANIKNPYKFLFDNLQMQNNIIDNCIKQGVNKVVFLSSSCVFPKDYKQPLKEEYLLKDIPEPTNEGYSVAKIAGLKLCEYGNKISRTNFISLAPCNLYGENQDYDSENSHVLAALIKKIVIAKRNKQKEIDIWGDGKSRREFLYVEDLVDCILFCLDNIPKTETFLNVGTGIDYSISELINIICEIEGVELKINYDLSKPNGMRKKCLDTTKINNLGWTVKTPLMKGVRKTIKHFKENLINEHSLSERSDR